MVEYKETFLDEMKALLLYFVEFSKDRSTLSKDYLEDCAVGGPNKRPIIKLHTMRVLFQRMIGDKKYGLRMVMVFFDPRVEKRDYGFRYLSPLVTT